MKLATKVKNPTTIKKIKKPWPTKEAMEQIYTKNLWGGDASGFYSGIGSHHPEIVQPYIVAVSSFLTSFKNALTVCDLGCGDFNVGKELVCYSKKYVAIDIVSDLIMHHKENFKQDNLEFYCLDISIADVPPGDCALVRQVLQHLSNAEVYAIAKKLTNFKYVIITEHLPEGVFVPNKDILSGQGARLKKGSGLDLLAPPFNLKVKEEKQLVTVTLNDTKGVIVTTLYQLF